MSSDTGSSTASRPGKLYETVASVLRSRIRDQQWAAGHRLPNLEELAGEFNVSNITIRQALKDLEGEGWISRRQGVGTFVSKAPPLAHNLLLQLETSWGSMIHALDDIEVTPLQGFAAAASAASITEDEGTPAPGYRYIQRLHSDQRKPYALVEVYLDERLYKRAPKAFDKKRVLHVLDSLDADIAGARQFMTIAVADIEAARLLGLALASPIGKLRRILTDSKGVVILVANIVYPADLVRLEISLARARPE